MRARTLRVMAHLKAALRHLHAAEHLLRKDYDHDGERLSIVVRQAMTPLIDRLKVRIAELLWGRTEPVMETPR